MGALSHLNSKPLPSPLNHLIGLVHNTKRTFAMKQTVRELVLAYFEDLGLLTRFARHPIYQFQRLASAVVE